MTSVHIVGAGAAKAGKREGKVRELVLEASQELFQSVPFAPDLIIVANMATVPFTNQNHLGAFVADQLGLSDTPAMRVESACGSGGIAVHQGFAAVKSGLYDRVMVIGVEKMTNVSTPESSTHMAGAADFDWEVAPGITFPGLNALIARRYVERFGVQPEDLTRFSVEFHKHAMGNPKAMFHKEITLEKAASSIMVADPLRLFDCSPVSDGSAAVMLVSDNVRKEHSELFGAEVAASRFNTDTISLQNRKDICWLRASELASRQAFKDAGITVKDVGDFNVHDAFSIMAALSLESFGVCPQGKATELVKEGQIGPDGDVPVNTMGGLKARGHPVGATGVYQVMENYLQLTDQAGKCQVPNVNYALSQNIGGSGASISVNICKRE